MNTFTRLTDYSAPWREYFRSIKEERKLWENELAVIAIMKPIPTHQIRSWANLLAGEARDPDWLRYSYVVPDVLSDIARELVDTRRGLIGLVGQQGVGKSSALMALFRGIPFSLQPGKILFKWRKEKDLFTSLLNFTHEATDDFISQYFDALLKELEYRSSMMSLTDRERLVQFSGRVGRHAQYRQNHPEISDILWAEVKIGKAATQRIRQATWLNVVLYKDVILIDTPDYSKTDKRRMDSDLEDIYWFWNNLVSAGSISTIVVAIQKELFRDHYFLDKMRKF